MALRIPVRYVNGYWEMISGGGLPVAEGALAAICIDPSQITDKNFLSAVTEKRWVRILRSGTPLCVAITPDANLRPELLKFFEDPAHFRHSYTTKINVNARFLRIHLAGPTDMQKSRKENLGGLWLKLKGTIDRGVESSIILLPSVPGLKDTAISLNHAFTMLSEVFETQRISHTGNVYEQVLYQESGGVWHPLKDLRNKELANAGRHVIKSLWDLVAAGMASNLFEEK